MNDASPALPEIRDLRICRRRAHPGALKSFSPPFSPIETILGRTAHMTSNFSRLSAILALSALSFASLIACGAPAPEPVPTAMVCFGPESPDDLEDFVDRDIVRHPDAACASGDPRFAFSQVRGPIPEIGEQIGDTGALVIYRERQRSRLSVLRSTSRTPAPTATPTSAPPASVSPSAPRTPAPRAPAATPAPTRAPAATGAPSRARVAPAPAPRRTVCTGTGSQRRCTTR